MKILGILIGLSGALVCILTQQSDDLAADAFNGNMLCLASSVFYAVYLVLSQRIWEAFETINTTNQDVSNTTVLKIRKKKVNS